MPQGLYSQHVICKQQDQLIARLRHVDLDQLLVEVLKQLTIQMLDGGPSSGLGKPIGESKFHLVESLKTFNLLAFRNVHSSRIRTDAYAGTIPIRLVAQSTPGLGIPSGFACHATARSGREQRERHGQ